RSLTPPQRRSTRCSRSEACESSSTPAGRRSTRWNAPQARNPAGRASSSAPGTTCSPRRNGWRADRKRLVSQGFTRVQDSPRLRRLQQLRGKKARGITLRLRLTRTRVAVFAIGVAAIVVGLAGSLGSAHAASGRQAIANTRPGWLGHARNLGHASAGASVNARIYLTPNGGMAKLAQFAQAVSTPGRGQYRPLPRPS